MTSPARVLGALAVAIALALTVPAAASAASFYVDQQAGDDTNSCSAPGLSACEHIQAAVNKSDVGDTIHVADPATPGETYTENVTLGGGRSLVSDSADPADNVIDGANLGDFAVSAFGSSAGSPSQITGFTIRGKHGALVVSSPSVVSENVFDEPGPILGGFGSDVILDNASTGTTLADNEFTDPATTDNQYALATSAVGTTQITGNDFEHFATSLFLVGGNTSTPVVSGNSITGTHDVGAGGYGIQQLQGTSTIVGNEISAPTFNSPSDYIAGFSASATPGPNTIGASLERNVFSGLGRSVQAYDIGGGLTLSGDLITGSKVLALTAGDGNVDDPGVADVTATNVTIADTAPTSDDIILTQNVLDLDSSTIDDGGINATDATCEISSSRGPTTTGTDCETFQTSADPGFVDAAGGDYHLAADSALIDAGNPAAPPAGAVDIDGDARAIANTCGGTARRDIGADERDPKCPVVTPPPEEDDKDVVAPETTIGKHPKKRLKKTKAKFTFSANEPDSTYLCAIDGKPAQLCSSPLKVKRLKRGKHTIAVSAVDAAGNADPTPASYRWRVVR